MPFDVLGKIARVGIGGTQYALIKARPDGNCLFHAAGHLLERHDELDDDGPQDHAAFRRQVVEFVEQHAKLVDPLGFKLRDGLGIALNAPGAVTEAQLRQIDRRVAYLQGLTHWGDEACITAIEALYDVEALVYDRTGSLTSPDGIRYYAPSRSPAAKLRLCVQFAGAIPYHYDLFWPDDEYDAALDGPDQTAAPVEDAPRPKKPAGPRKAPERQWRYFLEQDGLQPYGPPIAHQQFAYTAAWLAGKPMGSAPPKKSLSVALGGHENVSHGPPAPVVAVKLRNTAKEGGALESRSFSTAAGKEAFAEGYRERFFMPLQREGGVCLDLLDPGNTELVIETEEGKSPQPALVRGAIFQRVHGLKAAKTEKDDGLVAQFELDLAKAKSEKVVGEAGARRRYAIPAATVFDRALARFLTWERSPYQLVIGSAEDLAPASSAWTYLHVPSEWDVNTVESVALAQVLMLNEDLRPLLDAGVGASARGLANTAISGEPSTGLEAFELQAEARAGLERVLAVAGLAIDWNFGNYLVEGEEAAHYVSTSWASMVHLFLDPDDGWYYLDALYCSGKPRRAFHASADNVRAADERRAAVAEVSRFISQLQEYKRPLTDYVGIVDRVAQVHARTVEDERAYVQAELQLKAELIGNQTIKPSMKPAAISSALAKEMAARHPKLAEARKKSGEERAAALKTHGAKCQEKAVESNTALAQFHANRDLQRFLAAQKIPAEVAKGVTWLPDHAWRCLDEAVAVQKQLDAVYRELYARRERATLAGFELDVTAMVEGVKDFDTGGKPLAPGADWKQFLFKRPLRVSHAVTCGISSCAGGVTFTAEKSPSHVFLWHVDGDLSIPLRPELERLWPGGKGMPELRSVVSINPTPWELNKYRAENLYPAGTAERCQTLFLPRSCHLYGRNTVTAGGLRYGLDLSDGQVDLVFTYDFDNRAEPLAKWRGALAPDLPRLLVDLQDDLYGAYRDQGAKVTDSAAMAKYLLAATTESAEERNAIKRRMRAGWNKSCRVPDLCAATFETLAKSCAPVLELECFLGGEKADVDLMDDANKRWVPGSLEG